MITTSQFNALAVGQYTPTLNNHLFDLYGKIMGRNFLKTTKRWELIQSSQRVKSFFLVGYEDFSTISRKLNNRFSVDTDMDTAQSFHLKSPVLVETMETISAKVRSKYAPKTYFLMCTNSIFRHIRDEFSDTLEKGNYLTSLLNYARSNDRQSISSSLLQVDSCIRSYTKRPITAISTIATMMNTILFMNYLSFFLLSFSRQASLTHALKLLFSCKTFCSTCSSKSSSKRILFIVLLERSYLFFSFLSCIGCYHYSNITSYGCYHCKCSTYKKQCPEVLPTLSRHLTKTLTGVMIMAKSYDSAHLCARQSKLYKFYDLSTAQVVQTTATTERQARHNLGKQSLIFIARKPLTPTFECSINWGGYSHV